MDDSRMDYLNMTCTCQAPVESGSCMNSIENILDSAHASIQIVLACDEGYKMQLATLLRSIVESNRINWPVVCYVLSDAITEVTKKRVADSLPGGSAVIRWVPVDTVAFQDFWTAAHVSKMTFARLLIPGVLPDSVSKVLYLDSDILVLDDLRPLWEADLDGAIMGAVLDNLDPHFKSGNPVYEEAPRVRNYFNAGMLLIDLCQWRRERVSEKALAYMSKHPRTPFMDQDALNVVCDGRWKILDPRWNFHNAYRNISQFKDTDRPGIVHFVSIMKPWIASMLSVNAGLYDDFRSRTCFARTPWDKIRDGVQRRWVSLRRAINANFVKALRHKVRSAA